MTSFALARWAPALAIVGGLVGAAGDTYHLAWGFAGLGERSDLLATAPYRAHGLAIGAGYGLALAALAGLLVRWRERSGTLVALGALLAFVGTPFVVGDYWAESVVTPGVVASTPTLADADAAGAHLAALVVAFGVFALGWVLLAVGLLRARLVPRALGVVMALGAAFAFTPLAGSNLVLLLAVAALGFVELNAGRA